MDFCRSSFFTTVFKEKSSRTHHRNENCRDINLSTPLKRLPNIVDLFSFT